MALSPRVKNILLRLGSTIYQVIALSVTCVVIWVVAAFVLPYVKLNGERAEVKSGIEIFIKSNGVHTDFVVPARNEIINWKVLFPTKTFEQVDTSAAYLGFGWGDKGFYLNTPTWDDLTFSTAFNAAFGLGESAMHLTYYEKKPPVEKSCKKIVLSESEYKQLVVYIINSFEREKEKFFLIDHPGYSRTDNFYEAVGTYNLVQTCNQWTGNGLRAIGYPIGIWTPMESGIIGQIP
jgi:uncharacterized protein (TIGR02117 family)